MTRFLLGLAAGAVFALVLVHMYQIATGTYPAGKMEMVEREESPVEIALMLTSVVVWPLIGLLPRRLFLTAIGAGAGCVAGYFLAWALAGVRLGDPLWLEYQIGIRQWMPTTIPLGAVVGAILGLALGMWQRKQPPAGLKSTTSGIDTEFDATGRVGGSSSGQPRRPDARDCEQETKR